MELSIVFIVVIEFCERLCYYTFQGSQKSWLQDQGYSSAQSSSLSSAFRLLSYVSCLFGGTLADSNFGRYRTIAVLVMCYTVGCYVAAAAAQHGKENVGLYFVGTFALIAVGTGGIKPNVCTFGADQVNAAEPDADERKKNFFSYFYVTINLGALVAFGFLVSAATDGVGDWIAPADGYFFVYMVAASAMALALVLFLAGTSFYRKESMEANPTFAVLQFVRCLQSGWVHPLGKVAMFGWCLIPFVLGLAVTCAFVDTVALTVVTLVLTLVSVLCLCAAHLDNSWLGRDQVTRCLDCVPTLILGNLSFSVLYTSTATAFYSEACQMDTRIGSGGDQLNGAFFNIADCIAVIIFTPLINNLALPAFQRWNGRPISLHFKVYAGIGFAIAAQLTAAGLEYIRKSRPVLDVPSNCAALRPDGSHVSMSAMSAFWMCIPYALVGIGEVFLNPALLHFAYIGASPEMRSLLQSFNLFADGGMPSALTSALTLATSTWYTDDLNKGNLPFVYLLQSAIGLVGCGCYALVTSNSKFQLEETVNEKTKLADEGLMDTYT